MRIDSESNLQSQQCSGRGRVSCLWFWAIVPVFVFLLPRPAFAACPDPDVHIFYGNGIGTSAPQAHNDADVLTDFLNKKLPETGQPQCNVQVELAENRTEGAGRDILQSSQSLNGYLPTTFVAVMGGYLGSSLINPALSAFVTSKIVTLSRQASETHDEDLVKMLEQYRAILSPDQGSSGRIVIVAHSQGAVLANEAYAKLLEEYGPSLANRMRIVAVATPDDKVVGDAFVLPVTPHTTLEEDPILLVRPTPLPGNVVSIPAGSCGAPLTTECHDFVGSYLLRAGQLTTGRIAQKVSQAFSHDRIPVAGFTMSDGLGLQSANDGQTLSLTVLPGLTTNVTFNAERSTDPDGTIATWRWTVDGTTVTSSSFSRQLGAGMYPVSLVVTNTGGLPSFTASGTVVVDDGPFFPPSLPSIDQLGTPLSTGALTPTRLAISPSGQFLFAQLGSSIGVYNIGADGSLSPAGAPFVMPASNFRMAVDPLGRFLFVADTTTDAVSVFSVEPSGALVEVSGSPFLTGPNPQALAVSRDGHRVFAGNFGDAVTPRMSITVFDVDVSGRLTEVSGSPFATQFATPRTIDIAVHPTLPFVIVTGDDTSNPRRAVSVYSISAAGALSPVAGSPFVSGAINGGTQDVVISSDGAFVFLANTNDLQLAPGQTCTLAVPCLIDTVSVMKLDASGTLTHIAGSPFPVPSMDVGNLTDLAINATGSLVFTQYLYGAFPTFETTVAIHRMTAQGALAPFPGSPIPTGITRARGLAVSPSGNLLYAADSASRTIAAFRITGGPVAPPPSPTLSLFTSLGPGDTFGTGPYEVDGSTQFQAFRFIPTATGNLERIAVVIGRDLAAQASTVFNLYQDAGGSRGALIESFTVANSVAPDTTFPFTGVPVTFSSILKPRLTNGVAYWLEVSEPEVANGSFSFWFQNSLGMSGARITNLLPVSANVLPAFRVEGR